jgi:V8-like Glu-specific endopeptidase
VAPTDDLLVSLVSRFATTVLGGGGTGGDDGDRDLEPPHEVVEAIEAPLAELGLRLEPEKRLDEVRGHMRSCTVARSPAWEALLLHVPAIVLEAPDDDGVTALSLLEPLLHRGENVRLLSALPGLDSKYYPLLAYWRKRNDVDTRYVSAQVATGIVRMPPAARAAALRELLAVPDLPVIAPAAMPPEQALPAVEPGVVDQPPGSPPAMPEPPADSDAPREDGRRLGPEDQHRLSDVLARTAHSSGGSEAYFRDLLERSNLRERWVRAAESELSPDPDRTARNLIRWALQKGINIEDPRYTTLGSMLTAALEDIGLENTAFFVALIATKGLYLDPRLLERLHVVPIVDMSDSQVGIDFFDKFLVAPDADTHLQGFVRRHVQELDVGYMKNAVQRSAAVCRVEGMDGRPLGTGFLVTPSIVLTCRHVLPDIPDDEIKATDVVCRFGYLTQATGDDGAGRVAHLDPRTPILTSSEVNELDFALLALSEEDVPRAFPLRLGRRTPAPSDGVTLLHHPGGKTLKIAITANGVSKVHAERSVLQYVSETSGGSSGSPCLDDEWGLIAVHRAERGAVFGAVREGILFSSIHERIAGWL